MREIIKDYLDGRIPRRTFMKRMSRVGFGKGRIRCCRLVSGLLAGKITHQSCLISDRNAFTDDPAIRCGRATYRRWQD
jgi:hypothetical protein